MDFGWRTEQLVVGHDMGHIGLSVLPGRRIQRVHGRTRECAERTRLRRPVEIPERSGEAVEVMLGAVVIGEDGPDRAVRT